MRSPRTLRTTRASRRHSTSPSQPSRVPQHARSRARVPTPLNGPFRLAAAAAPGCALVLVVPDAVVAATGLPCGYLQQQALRRRQQSCQIVGPHSRSDEGCRRGSCWSLRRERTPLAAHLEHQGAVQHLSAALLARMREPAREHRWADSGCRSAAPPERIRRTSSAARCASLSWRGNLARSRGASAAQSMVRSYSTKKPDGPIGVSAIVLGM